MTIRKQKAIAPYGPPAHQRSLWTTKETKLLLKEFLFEDVEQCG